MKIERVKDYLDSLAEDWGVEKCRQCECLQGVLVQIKLDWPELEDEVDRFVSKEVHSCLGCEPCQPAEVWTEYLKEKEKIK